MVAFVLGELEFVAAQTADYERPPISYSESEPSDRVARLQERLAAGTAALEWNDKHGFLVSLLEQLQVPVESQTLVFSKTSLQIARISPRRPRALYFSDDAYVGYVQDGDLIEIAVTDPQLGAVFYSVKQQANEKNPIERDGGICLSCHASNRTQRVPGYLVRSLFTDRTGQPFYGSGSKLTEMSSPIEERWGGWYVTGTHGSMRHMGNAIATKGDGQAEIDREAHANRESLSGLVDTDFYLTDSSDIVALMVLAHQTQMHNAIAAANFETRRAIYQSFEMNKLLEREPDYLSDSALRRIDRAAENVVKHLLMVDEFELSDTVEGGLAFTKKFETMGPADSRQRSLRELDLKTRLFKYPCSFLIYSDAFDGLPEQIRERVRVRLGEILLHGDDAEEFRHLTPNLRREITEILKETKADFVLK